jgi:hypothetical protein
MALFKRVLILGAAGAAAAWFLKQKRESGEQPAFGGGGATSDAGAAPTDAGDAAAATDVGDAAAAGTGTSETLQEAGTEEAEPPADATVAREIPEPSQPTRVGNPVIPDTSADALVREQENAAAAEAGSIGGEPETPQSGDDVGLAQDPAMKPVVEAAGDEHETLEETERDLGAGRERQD